MRTVKSFFRDKTILIISNSGKSHLNALKKEIERREGKCILSNADTPNQRLKSTIKKSNCVIIFTEAVSIRYDKFHTNKKEDTTIVK